jgi:hypothetical protein
MLAAHARIAVSLMKSKSKLLKDAVLQEGFWESRTKFYLPKVKDLTSTFQDQTFQTSIEDSKLKNILKVALYTSK